MKSQMWTVITLDGRKFAGIARGANQNEYIEHQLRVARVIEPTEGDTRTKERRADDLVTQILITGRKSYILAGCLTEVGKMWSRPEAEANAARFAGITDPSEKAAMHSFLVEFAINFLSEEK